MNINKPSLLPRPSLYDYSSQQEDKISKMDKESIISIHENQDPIASTDNIALSQRISLLFDDLQKERARNRSHALLISELKKNYEELKIKYEECKDKNSKLEEIINSHSQLFEQMQHRFDILERFYKTISPRDSDSFDESLFDIEKKKRKESKKQRKKDKLSLSKSKDSITKSNYDFYTLKLKKSKNMLSLFKKKDGKLSNDIIDQMEIKTRNRSDSQLEGLSLETMNLYQSKPKLLEKKRSRSSDLTDLLQEREIEKEEFNKFLEEYIETNQIGLYSTVFGVKRGRCEEQCDCKCYKKSSSNNFSCETCGHFPYQHEEIGRLSDDEELDEYLSDSQQTSGTLSETSFLIDEHWLLDYDDFEFVDLLGKGNSSTVYLGNFKNQEVAIKVLRLENQKKDLEDFKKEMEIMSSIRSPYIVHFHGATMSPKPCIVLEYCSNGSLFHYLQNPKNKIDWNIAIQWMEQIAKGINTLHLWKPQVVHRDLKSLNLLLDSNNKVKVCDFGLSRFISTSHDQGTLIKMRGTLAYVAPEIYFGKSFTPKSDIYSYGIVLWEIITRILTGKHKRPYAEYNFIRHDFQIIIQAATKNLRPIIPESCPQILKELYSSCIESDPQKRPNCIEIIAQLENVRREYKANNDSWDVLVKNLYEKDIPVN